MPLLLGHPQAGPVTHKKVLPLTGSRIKRGKRAELNVPGKASLQPTPTRIGQALRF